MDINIEQVAFEDIVDLDELKSLLENFSAITGVTTGRVDSPTIASLLDNDCDMGGKTVERISEPYIPPKKTGKGSCLGFSVVH